MVSHRWFVQTIFPHTWFFFFTPIKPHRLPFSLSLGALHPMHAPVQTCTDLIRPFCPQLWKGEMLWVLRHEAGEAGGFVGEAVWKSRCIPEAA